MEPIFIREGFAFKTPSPSLLKALSPIIPSTSIRWLASSRVKQASECHKCLSLSVLLSWRRMHVAAGSCRWMIVQFGEIHPRRAFTLESESVFHPHASLREWDTMGTGCSGEGMRPQPISHKQKGRMAVLEGAGGGVLFEVSQGETGKPVWVDESASEDRTRRLHVCAHQHIMS